FPLIANQKSTAEGIRIWSAACSSGEEPFSIALTAISAFKTTTNLNVHILATDISAKVLNIAQNAIYADTALAKFPNWIHHNFYDPISEEVKSQIPFLHKEQNYLRLKKEIRDLIKFKRFNLMSERYPLKSKVDIIFCRNAMIYFDDEARNYTINKFYDHLKDNGLLFVGHSENLLHHT
ncbi:MAG: chemotaxis protein CheR, partial [Oligoflexia bacterium]|nr:chemotaxis protein CheR [Oligoflexia bacterium]